MKHNRSRTPKHGAGQQGQSPRPTHFLCIPLNTERSRGELTESINRFTHQLREGNEQCLFDFDIPVSAIRPAGTLHITIGVMRLDSEQSIQQAIDHLRQLDLAKMLEDAGMAGSSKSRDAARAQHLELSLGGLEPMHNPRSTSVLYTTPVDSTNRLLPFAQALRNSFSRKSLLLDDCRPLKLHTTIVNTVYAKAELGYVQRLDSTRLLESFKDFQWLSDFHSERIAICKMGTTKSYNSDGHVAHEAYEEIASARLPYGS